MRLVKADSWNACALACTLTWH